MLEQINGWWVPADDAYWKERLEEGEVPHGRNLFEKAMEFALSRRVAFDVGAHIGTWAKSLAARFRLVLAFEPDPLNFQALCANCPEPNIVKVNCAVGHEFGLLGMKAGRNSGAHFVVPGSDVTMVTLPDVGALDFLKIDVEGFEGAVMQGALPLLTRYDPLVVVENKKTLGHTYPGFDDPEHLLRVAGLELLGHSTAQDFVYRRKRNGTFAY